MHNVLFPVLKKHPTDILDTRELGILSRSMTLGDLKLMTSMALEPANIDQLEHDNRGVTEDVKFALLYALAKKKRGYSIETFHKDLQSATVDIAIDSLEEVISLLQYVNLLLRFNNQKSIIHL